MSAVDSVLVALSGGVDSATVAGMLIGAGERVVGVFMRNGVKGVAARRSCCSLSDARDARAVADRLGIPFFVHDMERSFSRLIDAFAHDYAAGLTPNPCVLCNNDLKFGELLALADDLGCATVATGHYARTFRGALVRAVDRAKDQSYLLHGLRTAQLARARFPIGELTKAEVRALARQLQLPVADKPDSADICFVPGGDYRAVVQERLGSLGPPGALVTAGGRSVGRHAGVAAFTVGQRRGLGVALGAPAFVRAIDPSSGAVQIGTREELQRSTCTVEAVNWLAPPPADLAVDVQLRHHHEPERARLRPLATGAGPDAGAGLASGGDRVAQQSAPGAPACVSVEFERPSEAVCPGQYAVFYSGDRVLGGGRIRRD